MLYTGTGMAYGTEPGTVVGKKMSVCGTREDGGRQEAGKRRGRARSTAARLPSGAGSKATICQSHQGQENHRQLHLSLAAVHKIFRQYLSKANDFIMAFERTNNINQEVKRTVKVKTTYEGRTLSSSS